MNLADRIEAATGPDRELDVAIFRVVKPEYASPLFKLYGTGMRHVNDSSDARFMPEPKATVPYYTASIDAALTLVPEGWVPERYDLENVGRHKWVLLSADGSAEGHNDYCMILALAAAAIKIKESERAD